MCVSVIIKRTWKVLNCIETTIMNQMGSHWYMSPWLVNIICYRVDGNYIRVYVTKFNTTQIPQIINRKSLLLSIISINISIYEHYITKNVICSFTPFITANSITVLLQSEWEMTLKWMFRLTILLKQRRMSGW